MRILVLGGRGMLGSELVRCLSPKFEVWTTIRQPASARLIPHQNAITIGEIDFEHSDVIDPLLAHVAPDVVVNCVGAIKQKASGDARMRRLNGELPWALVRACRPQNIRLIHFSTDCVFSGAAEPVRPRGYTEDHQPDPVDLYGRSKLEGEVTGAGCLTLRTSFIGREAERGVSLVEWFLSQRGKSVPGYCNALFTGVSTTTMAAVIDMLLTRLPDLSGLWQVSAESISKFDLLRLLSERGKLAIEVVSDHKVHCDRRLDSGRFQAATGWRPPTWSQMVDEVLAQPADWLSATTH